MTWRQLCHLCSGHLSISGNKWPKIWTSTGHFLVWQEVSRWTVRALCFWVSSILYFQSCCFGFFFSPHRMRWEKFPLCAQLSRCPECGDRDDSLCFWVRRTEVFSLLQNVCARQLVAANQTGTTGRPQRHENGKCMSSWHHLPPVVSFLFFKQASWRFCFLFFPPQPVDDFNTFLSAVIDEKVQSPLPQFVPTTCFSLSLYFLLISLTLLCLSFSRSHVIRSG